MATIDRDRLTAHTRAALTTHWLRDGRTFTTAELAVILGLTWEGASYLLSAVSLVLPIAPGDDGRWRWVRD
jgi:hypothetical protein